MGEQVTTIAHRGGRGRFVRSSSFVSAAGENKRVTRLCEVQDGSSSVSVCGLSLAASCLNPLLRALKLQASLTELRISGNRLHDNLVPELVAATITMPRLRLLDISANGITGDGLEKAIDALKGQSHPAFPVNSQTGCFCFVVVVLSFSFCLTAELEFGSRYWLD